MRKGELKDKAMESTASIVSEIASRLEDIVGYINGAKGLEADREILATVNADIKELWNSLN